jgi:hypothetical protein
MDTYGLIRAPLDEVSASARRRYLHFLKYNNKKKSTRYNVVD